VAPPPTQAGGEQTIPPGFINWVGADLSAQVLPIYAELVGRSIIRPASLPAAQLFFKNQTALTKEEAIQAIDAVLAMNGISMVNIGEKFVKAVPIAQAGSVGGAIQTNLASQVPEMGGYMTHVVQLKYIKPSEAMQVIQPFASAGMAAPIPIESSQILVLRDNAENIKRMLEMIAKVDVTLPSEFISEVIPIKFARVEDIAEALNSLSSGGGGTSIGGSRGASGGTGLSTGNRLSSQPYTPGTSRFSNPFTPQATTPTGKPSSTASFSDRIRNIISKASSGSGGGDLQILGVTKIVADARSNSLLIFATRQDMEMIKDIVNKLDVVLAQVLIETMILDVTLDNTFALGVSAAQTPKQFAGSFAGAGGMNLKRFTDIAAGGGSSGGQTNAFTDLIGTGLRYFGKVNDDVYIQIEAAASDGKVNVIQKPRIQTSHATPASIFIGGTVPYVSSTYYGGGYAGGPSSSYQQLPVGISLDVTPFINQDGLVVMQILQEIDELAGTTDIQGVGAVPNTTSRRLSAEVAVRDGETIMLGGFIRNSQNVTKSGVPFLKDIPLLGYLFRSTGDSKQRSELMVLMRPTVLRTPERAAEQVEIEKDGMPGIRAAEEEYKKSLMGTEHNEKKLFNKTTPFTPEEERLYNKPTTSQP